MEGYTDPSRYNEQPRVSGVVETSELSNYPELGPLGKGVSKQYANREPRFYASVAYNGSVWHMLNASAEDKEETNVPIFYLSLIHIFVYMAGRLSSDSSHFHFHS